MEVNINRSRGILRHFFALLATSVILILTHFPAEKISIPYFLFHFLASVDTDIDVYGDRPLRQGSKVKQLQKFQKLQEQSCSHCSTGEARRCPGTGWAFAGTSSRRRPPRPSDISATAATSPMSPWPARMAHRWDKFINKFCFWQNSKLRHDIWIKMLFRWKRTEQF